MKYLVLLLLTIAFKANSQETKRPHITNDSLYTSCGLVVAKGQKLKLGVGTMPDGNFKFIRINRKSIFHNAEAGTYMSGYSANEYNSMNRRESGKEYTIVRLEKRGDEDHGYVYYVVVAGTPRYEIDIENAIASGELAVDAKYKRSVSASTSAGIADELGKLKKLLDDGALQPDEYLAQKKKLLNKD